LSRTPCSRRADLVVLVAVAGAVPAVAQEAAEPPPPIGSEDAAGLTAREASELASPEEGTVQPADRSVGETLRTRTLNDPQETPEEDPPLPERREPVFLPVGRDELARAAYLDDFSLEPGPGRLGSGIKLTPWLVLRPSAASAVTYDSNVNRAETDEESDIVLRNSVTLALQAARPRWLAEVSYSLVHRTFADATDLSGLEHRGGLTLAVALARVTVQLRANAGRLRRPDDPRLGVGEVDRLVLDGTLVVNVQAHRRVGLQLEGTVQHEDFRDAANDDRDRQSRGVNALVTVSPELPFELLVGGGYREIVYDEDGPTVPFDVALASVLAGAQGALGPLSGALRLGYELGRITDDRGAGDTDDPSGLLVLGDLTWALLETTSVSLELSRRTDFAFVGTTQTTTRVGLRARHGFARFDRLSVSAALSWERQETRDFADLTAVRSSIGASWAPADWVVLGARLEHSTVNSDFRSFDVFRAGLTVSLRI